ncbi:hypothetical protein [Microcoleus sp. D2_18a_D3]|uniref:hypothetical protein n=1 Tax=Microcoleus sp. D2_18a_D3 TaxID=3055330 RepID=UPI002FD4F21F
MSDSSIAHDGAHRIKQASGYQSGGVASAIEEDFAAAIDARLSCIGRYCGDRRQNAI